MSTRITREELLEAIRRLPPVETGTATENGPISKPTDRYIHVPETTRTWFERLRPEDTQQIDEVRQWFNRTKIITGFSKWLVVALVGILLATGQVSQALKEFVNLFR